MSTFTSDRERRLWLWTLAVLVAIYSSLGLAGTLVGALRDNGPAELSGSAYVFERNVGGVDAWGQVAKLTVSDPALGDLFGWSVSISGNTAFIGAPVYRAGGVYVYERDAGGASNWGEVADPAVRKVLETAILVPDADIQATLTQAAQEAQDELELVR